MIHHTMRVFEKSEIFTHTFENFQNLHIFIKNVALPLGKDRSLLLHFWPLFRKKILHFHKKVHNFFFEKLEKIFFKKTIMQ